ncbi:MAG: HD domain-containing phosphohydrolase [Gemmatimonadaceae bacterium]
MKPLLIAPHGRALRAAPFGRREDDVELRRAPAVPTAGAIDPARPTVVLLDRTLLQSVGADRVRLADVARVAALVGIGDPDDLEPPEDFPTDLLTSYIPGNAAIGTTIALLRGAFRHAASLVAERAARDAERRRHDELTELTRVGVALSTERDLLTVLELILTQSRRISASDAGSVYLVERDEEGHPRNLRFKLAQNSSIPNIPLQEYTVPIDHGSLAGYAAATGEPLVIADVYLLPDDVEYGFNRAIDEKFGYRTKSMLVIPMMTHRAEVVGVLQLLNRKRTGGALLTSPEVTEREVLTYDQRSVELVSALASQAAVSVENARLYEDIERLFEGFVTAAVTAIESRDPTTSGHSGRVATLTVGLAEAIDRGGTGPYRNLRFTREQLREIRYAGLLHDFGKVGVREQVLVKEKKLYPADLEVIRHRFGYLLQAAELQFERERAAYLLEHGPSRFPEAERAMRATLARRREELRRFMDAVMSANEPSVMPEGQFEDLARVTREVYTDVEGNRRPLITPEEFRFLSIRRGNLDDDERREIESHVTHTYRFLEQIPWTRELRGIPAIAYGHHEKLNGQGYPRGIAADNIPVQTRMMTISDIYDALTATDRPYKRAVPVARALEILDLEARDGQLDRDLLGAFVEARVFEAVGARDWRDDEP